MKLSDLDFVYPEDLVAQVPARPSRVLWISPNHFEELTIPRLIERIPAGDVVVINDTKVEARRVFAKTSGGEEIEVLFVQEEKPDQWQVLCPARRLKRDEVLSLPGGLEAKLLASGRPQTMWVSAPLTHDYFERFGDMPLPPYIQRARGERRSRETDVGWYQTAWARKTGSSAAPTASLHFSRGDIQTLIDRGVQVETVTLHVGLGTYLPVLVDDLSEHTMHKESVRISAETLRAIQDAKDHGRHIWSLGTTSARALESWASGRLKSDPDGGFSGETDLLIQEGFEFKVVDRLMTNFHQPRSTLLALVCGFASKDRVLKAYRYAIDHRFRLFSYGDLSVWVNE